MIDVSYNVADIPHVTTRGRPAKYMAEFDAVQHGREAGAKNVKFSTGSNAEAKRLSVALYAQRKRGEFRGLIFRRGTDVYVVLEAEHDTVPTD